VLAGRYDRRAAAGGVVSAADRAGFLQVDVFAGGTTSVTLADGTTLAQSAPTTPFDPAAHTWSVAVTLQSGQMETIHAGALTLTASGTSNVSVKKILFRVRH
jgi:hypothetical protein